LAAAARSADALVYDKLTPYCHFIKINMYCGESDTFCGCSFCGGLSFPCRCRVQRRLPIDHTVHICIIIFSHFQLII
ncbi:MAG: hypothetical protein ACLR3U_06395, partial [Christensenellaceae bacterium]